MTPAARFRRDLHFHITTTGDHLEVRHAMAMLRAIARRRSQP